MKIYSRLLLTLLLAGALAAGGCAGKKTLAESKQSVISDPFEPVNRVFWSFNQFLDRTLLRPGARVYAFMFPPVWRRGIGNAVENIGMPGTIANDVLQLKLVDAARDTGRFAVNTTFGGLGLFDVASKWGMPEHSEDFGQTLGRWGVPAGPYLVPPFLPPTNMRDLGGFAGDITFIRNATEDYNLARVLDGCDAKKERPVAKGGKGLACGLRWEDEVMLQTVSVTDDRAARLRLDEILALQTDQYVFVREFLMKNRIEEIRNGGGGDDDDDDLIDELLDD